MFARRKTKQEDTVYPNTTYSTWRTRTRTWKAYSPAPAQLGRISPNIMHYLSLSSTAGSLPVHAIRTSLSTNSLRTLGVYLLYSSILSHPFNQVNGLTMTTNDRGGTQCRFACAQRWGTRFGCTSIAACSNVPSSKRNLCI